MSKITTGAKTQNPVPARLKNDPEVVKATEDLVAAEREFETITVMYQRTRMLLEGQDSESCCSDDERIQAQREFPHITEQYLLARLHLASCQPALKEAKDRVARQRRQVVR